ncbi:LysM peptidoglycan-binding domain-containing protein [Alicyclobacillus tolerans]|uniref:LysM peptidoglycan-binding domain-containing protein n=1 Tax=Alicyclobacillus tolerans TaxID=90970 RepID=UPI001F3DB574|nr:LysM peptidoglycan-binding domain-containing protein [Alicyclobacillus tolerans]MCF8567585.1 LysM peptidoglycan-binding domain-containing protein [Alicyclobacillus tolerans]
MRSWKLGIGLLTSVVVGSLGFPSAFAATTANSVTVQPGNTFWTISQAYGVSIQALEAANPSVNPNDLLVGTVLTLPSSTATGQSNAHTGSSDTATVQPGDTMWIISQAHGVSMQALESSNPSVNPNDLLVGTVLTLPQTGSLAGIRSTTSSAPSTSTTTSSTTTSAVSQQNLYWMEHAIHAEAGADSLQAQIAVGDVILHRLQAGGYGSTVQDVLFQVINGHYQFTSVANGYIYTTPSAASIQAAMDVLNNGDDVVPGAMVFYNPAYTPASSWVRSQPYITQIDNLVFAK